MPIYLLLAVLWLVTGGGLLVWQAMNPNVPLRSVLGTRISAGWVLIVLAVYDLVKWWSTRKSAARQAAETRAPRRPRGEPDANFDFSDSPP